MEDKHQLVAEFRRITDAYQQALEALPRRSEIVKALIQTDLTHQEVGALLGLSASRVGQLVKGAPGYVIRRVHKPSA